MIKGRIEAIEEEEIEDKIRVGIKKNIRNINSTNSTNSTKGKNLVQERITKKRASIQKKKKMRIVIIVENKL